MAKTRAGRSGTNLTGMTPFFLFVGLLILLDQVTKYLLVHILPLNTGKPIIPGFFNLVHVHNTGGAFSVFAGQGSPWRPYAFIGLTLVVVASVTYALPEGGQKGLVDENSIYTHLGRGLGQPGRPGQNGRSGRFPRFLPRKACIGRPSTWPTAQSRSER